MKNTLYFIKNPKTNLYWNGQYHSKDWTERIRFFKNAAALVSSLRLLGKTSYDFHNQYRKDNPYTGNYTGDYNGSYRKKFEKEWAIYKKEHKLDSISLLKSYCEENNLVLYTMVEGCAVKSAKIIE